MIHDGTWPAGTPIWADVMVPDRRAARGFYTGLFGWEHTAELGPEMGHYAMAHRGGRLIAGMTEGDGPPAWTTYLGIADADASVARAEAAGGTVLVPPMVIPGSGRMVLLTDPTGATVGLWEPAGHAGAGLVNEPGTVIWNELCSDDLPAARAFYGHVFGYGFEDMSADAFHYATFDLGDGRAVGGLGGRGTLRAGEAAHWLTYFATADTDVAVARAVELGGAVIGGPHDSPYGRMATVAGPAGETFALRATTEPISPVAG